LRLFTLAQIYTSIQNFNRDFLRIGSDVHEPLLLQRAQLLKEDVNFCWNAECDKELQYLKSCLMSEPILANIDPDKNFVIMFDAASNTGCGYQILQEGSDGRLHAVSYSGKALTKAQTRWLPVELELAALCLALKEIDVFAVHRNVIVFTDNTQVLHLDNWSPVGQRQRRMIHYLSQFHLIVKFVQGCKNFCADMLSRSFFDMSETDRKQFLPTVAEQSEDFILPVTVTSGDEQESEGISFADASDADDSDLTYCMLVCDSDLQDAQTPMSLPGDECDIPSGSNGVTRRQSYEPDSDISHPAQPDSSGVESDVTPILSKEPKTDTSEVAEDVKLESNNPEVPLDFLPKPSPQDYYDGDFGPIYRLLLEDQIEGNEKDHSRLLLTKDQCFIQNDLLYKLGMPRKAKLQRVYPVTERLCLPKNTGDYCHDITTIN